MAHIKIYNMPIFPKILLVYFSLFAKALLAQQSFYIVLPDAQITANRLVRGDGDTYGLGDWQCDFSMALQDTVLRIEGKIWFRERANDFTTIVGEYHGQMAVSALSRCRHCLISLDKTEGSVVGANIGARGYRWFGGQGLVRRARIQTDVFGNDVGNIGGRVQFLPVRIWVDCAMAVH